jgi:hypothetical protein
VWYFAIVVTQREEEIFPQPNNLLLEPAKVTQGKFHVTDQLHAARTVHRIQDKLHAAAGHVVLVILLT